MRGIEDALLDDGSVRVCNYDRAGEGVSDPAAEPQDDIDVADDLASLLAAAEIEPPYVLVGQSVGGDQAWLYADRHPEGLAALLLMNAGFFELDWDALAEVYSEAEVAQTREDAIGWLGAEKQAATPPDDVPYVVMMSTIAQCASSTDICGRVYPLYESWAQELADRTGSGRMVSVEAGHEIYQTQLDRVVLEIETLLEEVR
jgi:pimeloyl-ACP methyl ester carboxylesterase